MPSDATVELEGCIPKFSISTDGRGVTLYPPPSASIAKIETVPSVAGTSKVAPSGEKAGLVGKKPTGSVSSSWKDSVE